MMEKGIEETLRTSQFFREFDTEHLKKLAAIGRAVDFPAHHTIFEEHAPAKEVYVILSGKISLAICDEKKSCRQIASIGEGELLGWSPLVGRPRLYDTARTVTAVKSLEFNGGALMQFCESNPSFGFKFMHRIACTLAARLSSTRLQLLELCGVHLPEFQLESD
jgi:CRP/FNR family transcriptional regulator, cyclic AMP receptor protein